MHLQDMPQPKKNLTQEQLDRLKPHMRTILRLAAETGLAQVSGREYAEVFDHAEIHQRFMAIVGDQRQNEAGHLRIINLMTPATLGPTERAWISNITALGDAMRYMILGCKKGDAPTPQHQKTIEQRFEAHPELMGFYPELDTAVKALWNDFPPAPAVQTVAR